MTINFHIVDCFCNAMVGLLILLLNVKWCSFCLSEHDFMFSCVGLKFDRVSPRADLTNIVVGCSNNNSTSRNINWSVTCSPPLHYHTVPIRIWAGGSVTLNPPLHSHIHFQPETAPKNTNTKNILSMHVFSTIPSTVQYLTIKYRASVPSTLFFSITL